MKVISTIDTKEMEKNNTRDTNNFTQNFTKCLCGEWLLVNENVILTVSLNENQ